jgi:hypothetical protein
LIDIHIKVELSKEEEELSPDQGIFCYRSERSITIIKKRPSLVPVQSQVNFPCSKSTSPRTILILPSHLHWVSKLVSSSELIPIL